MSKRLKLLFMIIFMSNLVYFLPIKTMLEPEITIKTKCLDTTFFTPPLTLEKKKMQFSPVKQKKVPHFYFVHDATNKQFVLKYSHDDLVRDFTTDDIENIIHDVLGSVIGVSIGININDVRIVLPNEQFIAAFDDAPFKVKTLHTRMPGNPIQSSQSIKDGIVSETKLENLCKHKDLYDIMALDIFLNNTDRSKRNLFFNEQDGRYYGIDMDQIFPDLYDVPNADQDKYGNQEKLLEQKNSLANKSYRFLSSYFSDKIPTAEQSKALAGVNNTLDILVKKYPPKIIYNLLMQLAKDVGYTYCQSKQKFIFSYIENNFKRVQELQKLLIKLTNN